MDAVPDATEAEVELIIRHVLVDKERIEAGLGQGGVDVASVEPPHALRAAAAMPQ